MVGHPGGRGEGVVDGGREGVLGREAVVDGDDHGVGVVREPAAGLVVGLEVADDVAAAVQEEHGGSYAVGRGPVDARRAPAGERLLDRVHGHDLVGLHGVDGHGPEGLAGRLGRPLVHRRVAGGLDELQDGLDLRVERHGRDPRPRLVGRYPVARATLGGRVARAARVSRRTVVVGVVGTRASVPAPAPDPTTDTLPQRVSSHATDRMEPNHAPVTRARRFPQASGKRRRGRTRRRRSGAPGARCPSLTSRVRRRRRDA